MGSNSGSLSSGIKGEVVTSHRLSGISQKIATFLWGLVTVTSLLSLAFSVYRLNVWDLIPATQTIRYFFDMTPEYVPLHRDWQNTILEIGFSLSGYASIFSPARIIGDL